jgi:hypothetical protein
VKLRNHGYCIDLLIGTVEAFPTGVAQSVRIQFRDRDVAVSQLRCLWSDARVEQAAVKVSPLAPASAVGVLRVACPDGGVAISGSGGANPPRLGVHQSNRANNPGDTELLVADCRIT